MLTFSLQYKVWKVYYGVYIKLKSNIGGPKMGTFCYKPHLWRYSTRGYYKMLSITKISKIQEHNPFFFFFFSFCTITSATPDHTPLEYKCPIDASSQFKLRTLYLIQYGFYLDVPC